LRNAVCRWWNWDITIERSVPLTLQYTNLDTTLQFQDDPSVPGTDNLLLTSTTHGRYMTTNNNGTTPPRQIGVTLRLDF
jgi:hypothetical protein